jgi:hypothetical protein
MKHMQKIHFGYDLKGEFVITVTQTEDDPANPIIGTFTEKLVGEVRLSQPSAHAMAQTVMHGKPGQLRSVNIYGGSLV